MRVLVADDDRRVRLALRLFLEERGLVVIGEAASAAEIYPLVEGLRPDLLLLDWELPGLVEEKHSCIAEWARRSRVVALSTRPTIDGEPLSSPVEFVCKTDSPDHLIAALAAARLSRGEEQASMDVAFRSGSAGPDSTPRSGLDGFRPVTPTGHPPQPDRDSRRAGLRPPASGDAGVHRRQG